MWLLLACAPPSVLLDPPTVDAETPSPVSPVAAEGDTWVVACDGSGDFDTIQAGIDASHDGDVLHVQPCTYEETLDFRGRSIRVESTDGPETTVIDARGRGSVVTVATAETDATVLSGFTLTGGSGTYGSALLVDFASFRLENSILSDNEGYATVTTSSGDLELDGVTIADNTGQRGGVAILLDRGTLVADASDVTCGSRGSYAMYLSHGSAFVDWSRVACSSGYSVAFEHTVGRVQRSVLEDPVYVLSEEDHYDDLVALENNVIHGGISATYGMLRVRNSVVVDGSLRLVGTSPTTEVSGSLFQGLDCAIDADTTDFLVRYNDFWDVGTDRCDGGVYVGTEGNFSADPEVDDAWLPDAGSALVDAGPPETELSDPDGSRNDVGVYGGPRTVGGGW